MTYTAVNQSDLIWFTNFLNWLFYDTHNSTAEVWFVEIIWG